MKKIFKAFTDDDGKPKYFVIILPMLIPILILLISPTAAWILYLLMILCSPVLKLAVVIFLILNILVYILVMGNDVAMALPLAFCGRAVGGFIAAHTVNRSYNCKKEIGYLFILEVFFISYLVLAFCLFQFDYYSMLM